MGAPRREADAIVVRLEPVQTGSLERSIEVTGTLFGDEETTISAKLTGRIGAILADVGDVVGPGAELARLEATDYELALAERRAAQLAALAKLGLTRVPEAGFDLSEVPSVARARAEADNAQARFERGRILFEENPPLISEEELADLRTAAQVGLDSAAEAMVTAHAVLADSRTLAAQVAVAEQRLADTVIRAPGNQGEGRRYSVARRLVSEGEFVEPGHESFRLVSSDVIKYRAEIPERFSGSVRVGQTARVWVEAPGEPATGAVSRLAPNIDPESRTFQVEIRVDNKDGRLKPGAFARGRIVTHADEGVAFVPESAVVTFAGVHKVYSVRDGKAVEHRVRLGERVAGRVEVVGGLNVPEVVTEGAGALADGSPVRVNGS